MLSHLALPPQSIRITGRLRGDALGQMTIAEREIFAGTGSQTSTANRWGDYTSSKLDETTYCSLYIPDDSHHIFFVL
jgi:hypothetical protein